MTQPSDAAIEAELQKFKEALDALYRLDVEAPGAKESASMRGPLGVLAASGHRCMGIALDRYKDETTLSAGMTERDEKRTLANNAIEALMALVRLNFGGPPESVARWMRHLPRVPYLGPNPSD